MSYLYNYPEPPVEPLESGIYCEECGKELYKYEHLWELTNDRTGKSKAVCWECIKEDIESNLLTEYTIETTAEILGYKMIR